MVNFPRCALTLVLAACAAQACSGTRQADYPITPQVNENDPAILAAVTGAAVTTYALGGGCKIASCPADTVCNPSSERCERIECDDTQAKVDVCPPSSQCSAATGTCVPF